MCLAIDEFSETFLIERQVASFGRMPDAMEAMNLRLMSLRLKRRQATLFLGSLGSAVGGCCNNQRLRCSALVQSQ